MNKQNVFILYVGSQATGNALAQTVASNQWWVDVAEDADTALALYTTESPDIVVIDGADEARAAQVYHHLRSINAGPMLVLTNDRQWDYHAPDSTYTMLPPTDNAELVSFIQDVLAEAPVGVWQISSEY